MRKLLFKQVRVYLAQRRRPRVDSGTAISRQYFDSLKAQAEVIRNPGLARITAVLPKGQRNEKNLEKLKSRKNARSLKLDRQCSESTPCSRTL